MQRVHIYFQKHRNSDGFQIMKSYQTEDKHPWNGYPNTFGMERGKVYTKIDIARKYVAKYIQFENPNRIRLGYEPYDITSDTTVVRECGYTKDELNAIFDSFAAKLV